MHRPWETKDETKNIVEELSKNCDTYQRLTSLPVRFKVTLPTEEELVFGDEISMDLMWLDCKSVFHIIVTATRFKIANFRDSHVENYGQSVECIWS